jgi:Ca2+-binding EF-hand superfamily protein
MLKIGSWLLVSVLACFVVIDVASAKGGKRAGKGKKGKQSIEQRLREFDKDGDGKLSQSEFAELKAAEAKQKASKAFAKVDTNHDGSVSLEELKATTQKKGGKKKTK